MIFLDVCLESMVLKKFNDRFHKKDTLTQRDKLSRYICAIRMIPGWQPCIGSRNQCHGMKRKIGDT